jgi:thymidylate synthase (FAD)
MRPEAPAAEKILNRRYRVLDKGFVALVDYMGNDATVAGDARRSYQKGTTKKSSDERLTRRLYEDRHTSPFEMVELKFFVSAPLFVVREWFRHRTASINELSGRYSELPDDFFIPDEFRVQSIVNRQGSGDPLPVDMNKMYRQKYLAFSQLAYELYQEALANGMTREQARICLPVNLYTNFVWKIDLHNFLHFCGLRRDQAALKEIREYAHTLFALAETVAPTACAAFMDNHPSMYGGKFNRLEMGYLRRILVDQWLPATAQATTPPEVVASILAKLAPRVLEAKEIADLHELEEPDTAIEHS